LEELAVLLLRVEDGGETFLQNLAGLALVMGYTSWRKAVWLYHQWTLLLTSQWHCWLHQWNSYFELNLCKDCRSQVPNLLENYSLVAKVKGADGPWMCVQFEVLAVVLLRFLVFWDMMLCCWVSGWMC